MERCETRERETRRSSKMPAFPSAMQGILRGQVTSSVAPCLHGMESLRGRLRFSVQYDPFGHFCPPPAFPRAILDCDIAERERELET